MTPKKTSSITLGTVLRGLGVVLLIIVIILYVEFQARNFITGPTISLSGDYESVQYDRELTLRGKAENIVTLTLNGKEIHTDEQGNFEEVVFLEKGYSIVTLYAEDRFGRSTKAEQEYVYVEDGL